MSPEEELFKTLAYGEYTDGRVVFKCPEEFSCNAQVIDEQNITLFQLEDGHETTIITICSDYDSDRSQSNFNDYWKNCEDEEAKGLPSSIEVNVKRYVNSHPYFYKVVNMKQPLPLMPMRIGALYCFSMLLLKKFV